jgi:pteridine reductase
MSVPRPSKQSASDDAQAAPVALITGAGRRIGAAVAQALAAKGYRLILHVNHSRGEAEAMAKKITLAGGAAIVRAADLRDTAALEQMLDDAGDHFGRIDALVNCAAIWRAAPLEQVTPSDVREHFEINTLGTFICCQRVGLRMVGQESGGAIVNFGDWAVGRPYVDHAAYFPSKGAIPALTRTFAVELGRRNPRVRVNAVLPGPVMLAESASPEEQRYVIDGTLVKRAGTGDDIAAAVVFLIESTFITGACLPVDGGRSVYEAGASERGSSSGA